MLQELDAVDLTFCNCYRLWLWNDCSKSLHSTGVSRRILYSDHSTALWWFASDYIVAACRSLFRQTRNYITLVAKTFSASYTRTSIGVWILRNFCARNGRDSSGNFSSTLAFANFDIVCLWKLPIFIMNHSSPTSGASTDISVWFSWQTHEENSQNARTALITISSEAVSTAVFPSSLDQTRIGVQFTASVLTILHVSIPCQVPLFNESNGLEKHWRPGYGGTNVNQLSNWSLTFQHFRYLSCHCS